VTHAQVAPRRDLRYERWAEVTAMIRWLEDERLPTAVKANMARFKTTSFAKTLDEEQRAWQLMSWPRTHHTPLRFLLRSDDGRRASFVIDGPGRQYGLVEDG
jgi:hypothetical protein